MGEDDEIDDNDYGWTDIPIDGKPDPVAAYMESLQPPVVIVPTFEDRVEFFRRRGLPEAEAVSAAREYDGPM